MELPSADSPTGSSEPREHHTELRVRYAETDQMGIVYHANYLVWCEIGRVEWLRSRGISYADLERSGVGLAVVEANLRFRAPARYDDRIRVATRLAEVRSRSLLFLYRVDRLGGEAETPLVDASTALMAVTPEGRRRSVPADLLAAFRADVAQP